jgi:hypothetical protein
MMNELVELIVKKTGIPAATATTIVTIVIDFIAKKLPAPFGSQVKLLLNNDQVVSQAENILGGLATSLEKKTTAKKKTSSKKK